MAYLGFTKSLSVIKVRFWNKCSFSATQELEHIVNLYRPITLKVPFPQEKHFLKKVPWKYIIWKFSPEQTSSFNFMSMWKAIYIKPYQIYKKKFSNK